MWTSGLSSSTPERGREGERGGEVYIEREPTFTTYRNKSSGSKQSYSTPSLSAHKINDKYLLTPTQIFPPT